jgi:hypothetical protein
LQPTRLYLKRIPGFQPDYLFKNATMKIVADHNMLVILTGYWLIKTGDPSKHVQGIHPDVATPKAKGSY